MIHFTTWHVEPQEQSQLMCGSCSGLSNLTVCLICCSWCSVHFCWHESGWICTPAAEIHTRPSCGKSTKWWHFEKNWRRKFRSKGWARVSSLLCVLSFTWKSSGYNYCRTRAASFVKRRKTKTILFEVREYNWVLYEINRIISNPILKWKNSR